MDQRRQPLEVGKPEWRIVRRLWAGEARTEVSMTKLSDFEPKVDNVLTKLIASPYTAYVVAGCAIAGMVLGLIAYFK